MNNLFYNLWLLFCGVLKMGWDLVTTIANWFINLLR